MGSSRVLKTFNPKIFENELHLKNVFNLSMNQQTMAGNYFFLKEFIDEFHPKIVVLGITYSGLTEKESPKIVKLKILERLHGNNRLMYINDCFSIKEYSELLPIYAYRGNLLTITQNINNRIKYEKEGIHLQTKYFQFMGQGFVAFFASMPLGNMGVKKQVTFNEQMVRHETVDYLDKIVKLCKDHNIQLFLMTPPTSMSYIYGNTNYQGVINYIDNYAKKNNVIYHNLNFMKDRETLLPDSVFYDSKHLNKIGATIVSKQYAEILSKSFKNLDTNSYFYSTLDEMKQNVHRIVAVDSKPVIMNSIMTLPIRSLQNDDVTPYYQILLARKGNVFKSIIDWTKENKVSFKIPNGTQYRILLRARNHENDTNYAWMAWEVDKKGKLRKVQNVPVNGK